MDGLAVGRRPDHQDPRQYKARHDHPKPVKFIFRRNLHCSPPSLCSFLQPKTLPHWQSGVRIETCPARQLTGEHECAEGYYSERSLLRTPVEDLQYKNAFTLTIRALSVIAY